MARLGEHSVNPGGGLRLGGGASRRGASARACVGESKHLCELAKPAREQTAKRVTKMPQVSFD